MDTVAPVLFGRDTEVAEISTLLTRPEVRLLTLTGAGGIGKTRLAQTVLVAITDRFGDRAC